MVKIIHKELSYRINGLLFKTHKELGRFCRERQYADKFEELLKNTCLKYKREYELKKLKPDSPKGNRVDFLIENKIIIDLKTKSFITKEDYYQIQRYLKASNLELGLIVNFRNSYLKPKRVLNNDFYSGYSDKNSDNSGRAKHNE